jgi:hypothetical protein
MPILTIAQIRQQYPTPMREVDRQGKAPEQCYCVGGAIVQAFRNLVPLSYVDDWQFPGESALAEALIDINHELDADEVVDFHESQGMDFASGIIDYNEHGEFEDAWRLAEEALAYRHKEGA